MSEPTTVAEIEAWWANHHAAEEANPPTIARAYELAERSALKARAEYVAENPDVVAALGLNAERLPPLSADAVWREVKRRWPHKPWEKTQGGPR